jgi:hypothetical protein
MSERKFDLNQFLNSIKNGDNNIILDNVSLNIIYDTLYYIDKQFKLDVNVDFKKIMIHSYKIFLYNFILYLYIYNYKLYKLDKNEVIAGTSIFNISQLQLSSSEIYIKMRDNFTNEDTDLTESNFNYDNSITFKKHISSEVIQSNNLYFTIAIENLINNKYTIYKTNNNDFIITDITNEDLEFICRSNNFTLNINNKFNLPEFISENCEIFKNYLLKKYVYPQFNANGRDNLLMWHKLGTFKIFDNISFLYDKYMSLKTSETIGGNNNKYKICINKKTNYIYIIYNKKKCYFYKNNRMFIKIDNNNIYINKKLLSYDNESNSYFIIIK